MSEPTQKPPLGEWIEWAEVIAARLTTCVHTYSKPPYDDVLFLEKERQSKNQATLNLLRRLHAAMDESENLAGPADKDEPLIKSFAAMFAEAIDLLPALSADMQKLLKSEWYDKCNGRIASELFRGPLGDLFKGIGSGHAEQGRLPAVIASMLERERLGDARPASRHDRHALRRASTSDSQDEDDMPERATFDVKNRWGLKNRRTSGAVE